MEDYTFRGNSGEKKMSFMDEMYKKNSSNYMEEGKKTQQEKEDATLIFSVVGEIEHQIKIN